LLYKISTVWQVYLMLQE